MDQLEWLQELNAHLRQMVACLTREKEVLSNSLLRRENVIANLHDQIRKKRQQENSQHLGLNSNDQCCTKMEIEMLKKECEKLKLELISLQQNEHFAIVESTRRDQSNQKQQAFGIDVGSSKLCSAFVDCHGNGNDQNSLKFYSIFYFKHSCFYVQS